MEVSKGVTLTYIGTAILGFVIFSKSFEWMWRGFDALQMQVWFGILPITWALAIVATVILIFWMKNHDQIDPFIHETIVEMRKVTWPGWKDTQRHTIEVTVFTVILSFFLWGADQVWRPVTDYILTLGF